MRSFAVVVLLAVISACGATPQPTPSAAERVSGTVAGNGLTLAAVAEPATVATGQVIDVTATLATDGPADVVLSGSGSGIVFFSVTRLEDGLSLGPPISTGDCGPHVVEAGEPLVVPFQKSGGFSPGDANAEFVEFYNAAPELTLPPGTWRIDVTTSATLGPGCAGAVLDLALELVVTVTE